MDSQRIKEKRTRNIRRIRGLTQIHEWIRSGFTRVLTRYTQSTAVNPSVAFVVKVSVISTVFNAMLRKCLRRQQQSLCLQYSISKATCGATKQQATRVIKAQPQRHKRRCKAEA